METFLYYLILKLDTLILLFSLAAICLGFIIFVVDFFMNSTNKRQVHMKFYFWAFFFVVGWVLIPTTEQGKMLYNETSRQEIAK